MMNPLPEALPEVIEQRLGVLASHAEVRRFERDGVVFEEGSNSDGFFLVLSGEVAFQKRMDDGQVRTISYSRVGDYFGEIGVLTGHSRSLRAVATDETVIARIPADALVNYLRHLPGPLENLFQSVVKHLHDTTTHYLQDIVRQEKLAMVGSMMNSIIHDFKNPFCLISLGAQMIAQAHQDERTRKLCTSITDQVDRMVAMATELAEFSRGQHQLKRARVFVPDMLRHFQVLNAPFFEHAKVRLSIVAPEAWIEVESAKILRVLQNLVANAIEAMDDRPGEVRIGGRVNVRQRFVTLTVEDNGDGIPEPIRGRFFEPFVTHGKSGGTGLGSAIAKSIVEAHGGSISFQTETGRGTTFQIRLPLARLRAPRRSAS